jgi:U3 small nucleolar RNA-associated protein 10
MDRVEDAIVTATINILIKLRETELKGLFLSILDWLNILNDPDSTAVDVNMDRYSIFFRLVLQLLTTLKSVFVPYCTYFVKLSVQILRIRPEIVRKKKRAADGTERTSLQRAVQSLVIQSLHQAFLADTNRALPREFFDQLMEPLVEQLPNDALGPCLEELVARLGNHVLWKPLNHLLLMKTRSSEVAVRLAAIDILMKFFTRFGENWLVLLPETLSYIAELMEDQEQEVQSAVQKLIRTIEQLSGESLAQYLS